MAESFKLIPADLPIICSRGNTFKMRVQVKLSDGSFPNLSAKQIFSTLAGKNGITTVDLTSSTLSTGLIVCLLDKSITINLKEEEYEFRLWWVDEASEELHLIGGIYQSWPSWKGKKNTLNNLTLTVSTLNSTLISLEVLGYTTVIGGSGSSGGYDFIQSSPSTLWTINHNLGYRPVVALLSVGGIEMWATIVHISVNQVQVSFISATAGRARLS